MNYKKVDGDYLKDKIENGGYPKYQVQKTGLVRARILATGDVVKIYYYNDIAEIETKYVEVFYPGQVLVTKTINNKEYNSVMSGIKFHKNYRVCDNDKKLYVPVVDPIYAYEVNENIEFQNVYNQCVQLCPGDFVVAYDASHQEYYSIYKYNFQDNYELSN